MAFEALASWRHDLSDPAHLKKKSKPCNTCHHDKPMNVFPRITSAKDGRGGRCNTCIAEAAEEKKNQKKSDLCRQIAV